MDSRSAASHSPDANQPYFEVDSGSGHGEAISDGRNRKILDQLTHAESLPKAALEAASAQRAEMLPIFLHEIDSYLALDAMDRAKPTPLFFIFHLLGEWREKAAYRPLARLMRCPSHEIDAVLGGVLEPRRLVFIDETGTATNRARRRGRGRRGSRLIGRVPHGH